MTASILRAIAAAVAGSGWFVADVPLRATRANDSIRVAAGREFVTAYHFTASNAKPFFYPLHTPAGIAVTRDWPMRTGFRGESTDHVHQRSLWFCHGDVVAEGVEPKVKQKGVDGSDFWTETGGPRGRIVPIEVGEPTASAGRVSWSAKLEWRSADGTPLLREACQVTVVNRPTGRLIVYRTELRPAAGAVTFADTKEGAFGCRVHDQLRLFDSKGKPVNRDARITLAGGRTGERDCWGQHADWCDYSGPIDGRAVGLAVFDHPANAARACWHVRGYGLMAANPFGRGKSGFPAVRGRSDVVRLDPGASLKLCYGAFAHDGDATEGRVADEFAAFAREFGP